MTNGGADNGLHGLPDVNKTGEVLAQLNDWRAITFVLVFIIVVLLLERIWAQREMRLERKEARELANQFGTSADKVANALHLLQTEVAVLRSTSATIVASVSPPPAAKSGCESASGGDKP